MTDHAAAPGCRPALNIDVLRVLGVCRSPRELLAAMAALEARFGGCGRVKNGFATADAKAAEGFHLRVMMGNFVVDFRCTYTELAGRRLGLGGVRCAAAALGNGEHTGGCICCGVRGP